MCDLGSRDGSMGLWEVTDEVLSRAEQSQSEEGVPCYSHISHRALKDIPKEYTNPYNCKVRALAFNNNHKVRPHALIFCLFSHCVSWQKKVYKITMHCRVTLCE